MKIAVLLYEGMTALDAIGPYEVLARIPGAELTCVGEKAGPIRTDTGALGLVVDRAIADIPACDVLVVPGGPVSNLVSEREPVLEWLRRMHEGTKWTASVCTGSLILGAAGILEGVRATTHWTRMDLLADCGAIPVPERVVRDGKIITGAGVSAGIDMALTLAAELAAPPIAQAIQLGIEYDPAPPFDSGSPHKAPTPVVDLLRQRMA